MSLLDTEIGKNISKEVIRSNLYDLSRVIQDLTDIDGRQVAGEAFLRVFGILRSMFFKSRPRKCGRSQDSIGTCGI